MQLVRSFYSLLKWICIVNLLILSQASRKGHAHEKEEPKPKPISAIHSIGLGFGNLSATSENIPSGYGDPAGPDAAEVFAKAACGCCGRCWRHCCCMCCIQACSRMNDQCAIVFIQLFSALACLGCYSCCSACCGGEEWVNSTRLDSTRSVGRIKIISCTLKLLSTL